MPHAPRPASVLFVVIALGVLTLGPGLGGNLAPRLTYHEAIVAQGAREMLAAGDWLVPTINGQPWIEKPPLAHWLTMLASLPGGRVTEFTSRLPSALAAIGLIAAITWLATRRLGSPFGILAGTVQATTYWAVVRGHLADADVLLAFLVAASLVALEILREPDPKPQTPGDRRSRRRVVLLFFALLGATSLAKGIGFGAVLVGAIVVALILWDRDVPLLRRLLNPSGIALVLLITFLWPLLLVARHPEALRLWTVHISDRLAERPTQFAGGPWWSYPVAVVTLALPWTPIALVGLRRSITRAWRTPGGFDRFLLAWAFVPLLILSCATIKNAHYAIHALPPWSIWTALGLVEIRDRLQARGWSSRRTRRAYVLAVSTLALGHALTFGLLMGRIDGRGREWNFYEQVSSCLHREETLVFLHDDWDRLPYQTPFGPVPHDLAVRLFYLDRDRDREPTIVSLSPRALVDQPPASSAFSVVARDRDLAYLESIGRVELIVEGPTNRWDRRFGLYRIDRNPTPRLTQHPAPSGLR